MPPAEERTIVHDVIFNELCRGILNTESKKSYVKIVENLYAQGAEAVILGCTEIALLIGQSDTQVPLYDTTQIHAAHAVAMGIKK